MIESAERRRRRRRWGEVSACSLRSCNLIWSVAGRGRGSPRSIPRGGRGAGAGRGGTAACCYGNLVATLAPSDLVGCPSKSKTKDFRIRIKIRDVVIFLDCFYMMMPGKIRPQDGICFRICCNELSLFRYLGIFCIKYLTRENLWM